MPSTSERKMKFIFDHKKAVQMVNYFTRECPNVGRMKAAKLMFFADKQHLLNYGRPISGDYYCAMKDGPVPSNTYNIMKGESRRLPVEAIPYALAYLDMGNPLNFSSKRDIDKLQFSKSDRMVLDQIGKELGLKTAAELRKLSHTLPEWSDPWYSNDLATQVPMEFEKFFGGDLLGTDPYLKARQDADTASTILG